jgi:putative tricarboxylic transport membrane protein
LHRDQTIGGIFLFLFGAATVYLSLRMPVGSFRAAGSGLFPLCLGILLMVLSGVFVLQVLLGERQGKGQKGEPLAPQEPTSAGQVILFVGATALATFLFNVLGYPLVSFLLLVTLLRILGMKGWGWNILLSLVTASVSYFLFVQWLKIPLPKGWLGL